MPTYPLRLTVEDYDKLAKVAKSRNTTRASVLHEVLDETLDRDTLSRQVRNLHVLVEALNEAQASNYGELRRILIGQGVTITLLKNAVSKISDRVSKLEDLVKHLKKEQTVT